MSYREDPADEFLSNYNWRSNKYDRMAGTEDWELVAAEDSIGGYEWDTFAVFWSPIARRYFWGSASGCSCNSYSGDFENSTDFQDGDREAALRAVESWREGEYDWERDRRREPAANLAKAIRAHARRGR